MKFHKAWSDSQWQKVSDVDEMRSLQSSGRQGCGSVTVRVIVGNDVRDQVKTDGTSTSDTTNVTLTET